MIDPVMVAESGASLLDEDARAALVERLLPLATVATPNLPEARALSGAGEAASQEELARAVLALGPRAVVVTGGHSERNVDLFDDGARGGPIEGERHPAGPRTAPAAPTPRRWPPSSPAARGRWKRRGRPARSPRRRSPPASVSWGRARARSTSVDSALGLGSVDFLP